MDAKEFIIKKFEQNNPELLKVIEEWTQHSINQNWDELRILLNQDNVPQCPKNEYDEILKANKQYLFLLKTSQDIIDYLMVKGFTYIISSPTETLITPTNVYQRGFCLFASIRQPINKVTNK